MLLAVRKALACAACRTSRNKRPSVLRKTPARIIAALASLDGNSDFEEVCKWLDESLSEIRASNDSTRDEVQTRWNQGGSQVLAEFLEKKRSARDTLYKMK